MYFVIRIGSGKVFGEVLGRKVAILVYENINLKKIDFFHLFFLTQSG